MARITGSANPLNPVESTETPGYPKCFALSE